MSAFNDAVEQVRNDLKEHGKANVTINVDEHLTSNIIEHLIRAVAKSEGLKVETKANEKSVSGKVVTEA